MVAAIIMLVSMVTVGFQNFWSEYCLTKILPSANVSESASKGKEVISSNAKFTGITTLLLLVCLSCCAFSLLFIHLIQVIYTFIPQLTEHLYYELSTHVPKRVPV